LSDRLLNDLFATVTRPSGLDSLSLDPSWTSIEHRHDNRPHEKPVDRSTTLMGALAWKRTLMKVGRPCVGLCEGAPNRVGAGSTIGNDPGSDRTGERSRSSRRAEGRRGDAGADDRNGGDDLCRLQPRRAAGRLLKVSSSKR
jgi:hypothetical protein